MRRNLVLYARWITTAICIVGISLSGTSAAPCQPPPDDKSCGCGLGPWVIDEPSCVAPITLRGEADLEEDEALVPPTEQAELCSHHGGGIGLINEVLLNAGVRVAVDFQDPNFISAWVTAAGVNAELVDLNAKFKGQIFFLCNRQVIEARAIEFTNFSRTGTNLFETETVGIRLNERAEEFYLEIRFRDAEGRARVRTTTGTKVVPIQGPEASAKFRGRR